MGRDQFSTDRQDIKNKNFIMENSERLEKVKRANERLEEEIAKQDLEMDELVRKIREEEVRQAEERSGRGAERDQGSGN